VSWACSRNGVHRLPLGIARILFHHRIFNVARAATKHVQRCGDCGMHLREKSIAAANGQFGEGVGIKPDG